MARGGSLQGRLWTTLTAAALRAGAAVGDPLYSPRMALDADDAAASLRGRRDLVTLCSLQAIDAAALDAVDAGLSCVAGAALGVSLQGCLTPLTPRLSRVAGAALGDLVTLWDGCLTPLTPLTLWLSRVAGAALGNCLAD